MATVDIVIPTYRGVHPECDSHLTAMIREAHCFCGTHEPWKCTKGKHSVRLMPRQRGTSVVHWARNQMIAMALYGQLPSPDGRPAADYFFLMDDDMLCRPDHLSRLLSYKLDFVTGIATVRRDPPRPNIRLWSKEKGHYITPWEWDWDSNRLMEVDAVGAAFCLIRRRVLEKVGAAWLDCYFERAEDRRKYPDAPVDAYWDKQSARRRQRFARAIADGGEWKEADCWWFQFLDAIDENQIGELGEDVGFCWKVKNLGFQIFADPQVKPGHIGDYGYSIDDYRDWVEAQKARGDVPELLPINIPQMVAEAKN